MMNEREARTLLCKKMGEGAFTEDVASAITSLFGELLRLSSYEALGSISDFKRLKELYGNGDGLK